MNETVVTERARPGPAVQRETRALSLAPEANSGFLGRPGRVAEGNSIPVAVDDT